VEVCMYRHIKDYQLRYTDVDAFDNLKLSSLLSFLEESACLSADELGFGYADVAPKNIGFIVVNWYIKLNRNIKLGDLLTVHTWPLKPKHLIFLRDYELYCGDEKVGVCTARWCMIDTVKYAFLPVSAFFSENFFDGYNTERSIDFRDWKIPNISSGETIYSKKIMFSDYDHYFHVNNTKYADFMFDVFSVEELQERSVSSVQITYVKQCKEGEEITFSKERREGFYLVEGKVGDELRVQMRIEFNDV
ncbi:MAG: hypothetical protein K2N23_01845, partial [Clostridia bacterium]|nr:hypothetical protein [Clostridia bacterium]